MSRGCEKWIKKNRFCNIRATNIRGIRENFKEIKRRKKNRIGCLCEIVCVCVWVAVNRFSFETN